MLSKNRVDIRNSRNDISMFIRADLEFDIEPIVLDTGERITFRYLVTEPRVTNQKSSGKSS